MENQIWGYVIAILSSSAVTKLIDYLIARKSNRAKGKSAEAEATTESFEGLHLQIKHLNTQIKEAYSEVEKTQKLINELRNTNRQLTQELAAAQIELAKAQARANECKDCESNPLK